MVNVLESARKAAAYKAAAIKNLGSDYHEASAKAKELYEARTDQAQSTKQAREERDLTENHPFDLFVTPVTLATHMVYLADLQSGCTIIEPSAGTGRIAQAIRDEGYNPLCIELNYQAAELLRRKGFATICGDFLDWQPESKVDRFVMNPPFSNSQDIDHVKHAYEMLAEGGRLVAIMSEGSFTNTRSKASEFRDWLNSLPYHDEQLEEDTFKASGTRVRARLVVIDKERSD